MVNSHSVEDEAKVFDVCWYFVRIHFRDTFVCSGFPSTGGGQAALFDLERSMAVSQSDH